MTATLCLFCAIASRQRPADLVYEDEEVIAFRDIHPKYRVHILLVPKRHLSSLAEATEADQALLGKLQRVGAQIAAEQGMAATGFRLLTNTGRDSGQVVDHLHVHLLGGEPLHAL